MIRQKFKTGDRVKLISGGPDMTVLNYEPVDSDQVICQWFSSNDVKEKAFHQDTLKISISPTFRKGPVLP